MYQHSRGSLIKVQAAVRGFIVRKRFRTIVHLLMRSKYAEPLKKKNHLLQEILQTEQSYIDDLTFLIKDYFYPLLQVVSQDILHDIFANIESILQVHISFFSSLKAKMKPYPLPVQVGHIFLDLAPKLAIYTRFVNSYDCALKSLARLENERHDELKDILPGKSKWNTQLNSHLIKPIQRVPRYMLLLEKLMKYTCNDHQDYQNICDAYAKMTEVAAFINDSKREVTRKCEIEAIENRLTKNSLKFLLPVLQRGMLRFRSGRLIKGWSNRFFVLRGCDLLCFPKAGSSNNISRAETFRLDKCQVHSKGRKNQFQIIIDKVKLNFRAANEAELNRWILAVETASSFPFEIPVFNTLAAPHRRLIFKGEIEILCRTCKEEDGSDIQGPKSRILRQVPKTRQCLLFNDLILLIEPCGRSQRDFRVLDSIHLDTVSSVKFVNKLATEERRIQLSQNQIKDTDDSYSDLSDSSTLSDSSFSISFSTPFGSRRQIRGCFDQASANKKPTVDEAQNSDEESQLDCSFILVTRHNIVYEILPLEHSASKWLSAIDGQFKAHQSLLRSFGDKCNLSNLMKMQHELDLEIKKLQSKQAQLEKELRSITEVLFVNESKLLSATQRFRTWSMESLDEDELQKHADHSQGKNKINEDEFVILQLRVQRRSMKKQLQQTADRLSEIATKTNTTNSMRQSYTHSFISKVFRL